VAYVITDACVDVKDKSCIEECPVDCIKEGENQLFIDPDDCIDCGACQPACPVEAIYFEHDLPSNKKVFIELNRNFFTSPKK
jgi:ferredoxin